MLSVEPSTGALNAKGKEQRDQLNAIRETLEQLEGGTTADPATVKGGGDP